MRIIKLYLSVCYSPYWEHTLEGYQYRNHPNFCFLFFEDMKKVSQTVSTPYLTVELQDFLSEVQKVAIFLKTQLSTETMTKLSDFLNFDNCKKRWQCHEEVIKNSGGFSKEGNFYRKGGLVFINK